MQVTEADNGQTALNISGHAQEEGASFPLMLLEAHMPEMDGFAVAVQIQECRPLTPENMSRREWDATPSRMMRHRSRNNWRMSWNESSPLLPRLTGERSVGSTKRSDKHAGQEDPGTY